MHRFVVPKENPAVRDCHRHIYVGDSSYHTNYQTTLTWSFVVCISSMTDERSDNHAVEIGLRVRFYGAFWVGGQRCLTRLDDFMGCFGLPK